MAVVYMKKLESEPSSYEKLFTELTKGINLKVNEWIIERLGEPRKVLEIGPGSGELALEMAKVGHDVTGVEPDFGMLQEAKKKSKSNEDLALEFKWGDVKTMNVELGTYEAVVSTFVLSELRHLEQQIFLQKAWIALKPGGKLLVAAEFVPTGVKRLGFLIKRWWYKRKLGRKKTGEIHPLKWFSKYPGQIGFNLTSEKSWGDGSIRVNEYEKASDELGYYTPPERTFKGGKAMLRGLRCILTGQVDHVPIEPGIYKSGNPTGESPVIVTANYDYTYIKVMRDLEGIDAWVLCVDSQGINVWCAARGGNFGNMQLKEVVQATNIQDCTTSRQLILPQLSAGGIESPKLLKKSARFPFKIKFGPVWSSDLPEYLEKMPARKPDSMKRANFSIGHRSVAGVTHLTFSIRKIFMFPLLALLLLSIILKNPRILQFDVEMLISLILTNLLLVVIFPLTKFTRAFIIKGLIMGLFNTAVMASLSWFLIRQDWAFLWHSCFHFWIGVFSTMSFSGYTMATSPREIGEEYPKFIAINITFLIIGIILSSLGIILN
ncbi:MAG: methyltransferase domain-containing protein [Candidatus Hodarchaeota archaeon]